MNSTRQRCSFCRETGHNVKTCDNELLIDFRVSCLGNRIIFGYEAEPIRSFYNWLCNIDINVIKAFGTRFCKINKNDKERMNKIINYVYNLSSEQKERIIKENYNLATKEYSVPAFVNTIINCILNEK
jgi:hypothetical protein